jgi:hypothetical protein
MIEKPELLPFELSISLPGNCWVQIPAIDEMGNKGKHRGIQKGLRGPLVFSDLINKFPMLRNEGEKIIKVVVGQQNLGNTEKEVEGLKILLRNEQEVTPNAITSILGTSSRPSSELHQPQTYAEDAGNGVHQQPMRSQKEVVRRQDKQHYKLS